MGLSLRPLGRKIGDVLGTAQHGVSRTVAQVNPLDNGRTWQNPQGKAPTQQGPAPSAFQQVVHSAPGNFIAPIARTGSQLGQAAYHIGALPIETVRTATAELTGNQAATRAGVERGMQGINAIKGLAQGSASMAYQLGESLNPAGGDVYNRQHTFQNPVAKAVFGSAPVSSIQKQFKDTKASKGAAQASGEAVSTALMDALGVKGAAAKAPVSAKQVVDVAKKAPVKLETPEIAALKAQKQESLGKYHATTSPKVAQTHLDNVNSIDRQIATLQARGGAKAGDIFPDKAFKQPKVSSKGSIAPDEGKVFYHGTNNPDLKTLSDLQAGQGVGKSSRNRVYITENPEIAKNFGSNVVSSRLYGKHLNAADIGVKTSPDPFIDKTVAKEFSDYKTSPLLSEKDKRVFENSFVKDIPNNTIIEDTPSIHKYLASKGYSTITVPRIHSDVNGLRTETIIIDQKTAHAQPTQVAKPKVSLKAPAADKYVTPEGVMPGSFEDTRLSEAFASRRQAATPIRVSSKEEKVGKALGMSKDQVAEAKANMAELPAREQMAQFEAGQTPLAPAAANTAKNPFKAPIPDVKAGDYKQIVSNEQAAANPVLVAGDRWKAAMQKLQKKDPVGYNNFWRNVEDPMSPKSAEMQKAIQAWRNVDDRIHGTSQSLGGNTNYLTEHGLHPWNLPDELAQHLTNGGDINKFPGLNSISRKYRTIAEGEANGLTLGTDPLGEGSKYIGASAGSLRRRAIVKGIGEADGHLNDKTHFLDLGGGETIPMSAEAHKALRGLQKARYTDNKAAVGVRTVNSALRTTILSGGQFHPINISLLRAAPSIAMAGHPVRAVKGAVNTFTATKGRVGKMYESALNDKIVDPGTGQPVSIVDAAAKIGAQYAQKGYETEGSALKSGVGHKLVFEQQIPMMHDQVVRSVLSDLVKKGVPLDSKAAREAGIAANSTMGFINKEALNVPTWVRKGMSDWMLASQFTPSKIVTLSKFAKGGVAGKYARSDVLSNVVAATALITGVGYALGQTSDSLRDSLLRALVNPAIPTPMKDKKGNNIELRIPLTYTGEISKILGIKLHRNPDGHLGVDWHPSETLSAHGGLAEWMRSRLAPVQSTAVKLATNTNFSDKPLSDPNAPAGTRAIQDATTIGQGFLPIGLQGIPNTKFVKDHVPGSVKEILDANTPGANPVVKGFASSAGFSPRTDQTVGKGLETARYFNAVDEFKPKDRQAKDAYDLWTGSKKNPVTGKYDVNPSVYDASTKANALLQNPKAFDAIYNLNQSLAKQGEKVDPLWSLPKDNIRKYLDYQHMPPGSADKTNWYNKNGDWYGPLVDQRNAFFDSLPKGDPNKPKLDLQFPDASQQTKDLMGQYSDLTDPAQKGAFLDAHPDVIKQWNAQSAYTNKLRDALGYTPLKNYPEATPQLQEFIDKYSNSDKGGKKGIRNSSPDQYKNMIAYFDSLDLYNIGKQASVSQLQGEPDYTSKEAKAIQGLAKDIYQNPDGTYSIVPAGWMQGLSNGSGGGYGGGGGYGDSVPLPSKYALSLNAGGKIASPKVSVKLATKYKSSRGKVSKPKVTLKASKV